MKNYFVEVKHGSLNLFIAIRGESQNDSEIYIMENPSDLECRRITSSPFTVIPHEEGWKPTQDQIWKNSNIKY